MIRARRIAATLCIALAAGTLAPLPVYADTPQELQAQLEQSQAALSDLYANAEDVSNQLNKTTDDLAFTEQSISDTQDKIEDQQAKLSKAQQTLGRTVAAQYKQGKVSLLSIIMSSKGFDDFLSRIYYANKISESYNRQIREVKDIQSDLAQQKVELEEQRQTLQQLLSDQEAQKAQLEAKAAEVESYVAGLSAEVQEALEAEAAARAEEARAAAAATLQEAGGSENTGVADAADATSQEDSREAAEEPPTDADTKEPQQDQATQETDQEAPTESADSGSDTVAEPASNEPSSMDARTAVVNYVLAQVGKPYVWATHGPDSFDCSGLTGSAYQQIGYFIGYSDSYQEQYCTKPASEAVYGDIVWRPGHVGICIGGGVTVEAFNPSRGVGYGSVSSFQRSGSPLA